ncbi:MAG: DUF4271 domain-containing protein [Flavobacteriaceae bacterium]
MGEWIYRTSVEHDWISFFYFINLVFIVGLHFSEPYRFWDLLKSFSSTISFSKYSTDQNLKFRGFFNLFSGLLILSNLGLLLKLGIEEISKNPLYAFEFYYILLGIVFMVVLRFIGVQFILGQIDKLNKINTYNFKVFTQNTKFSLLFFLLLFIKHYTSLSIEVTLGLLVLLFLLWLFMQARILFSFIKINPKQIFYLFFYLCTVKIAPWFWLYFFIIETRL